MLARMELVVTLLIVGAILLILETVLPGMVAGIVGGVCLLAGIVVGYVEFGARVGTGLLFATVVLVVAGFALWVRVFPESRYGRKLISRQVVGDIHNEQPELLHQSGTAFTQLRPSGTALINGRRVDVVTEGALVEKGTAIKVVAIEGMRVVVRACADSPSPASHPTHS